MYVDSRELPDGHRIEADVCIVGAGFAGITIANQLAGTKLRVCLLEGGGFEPDAESQALYEGTNSGLPYTPLHAARTRYFGGTSSHWSGWCRPLDPFDLEQHSWVPHSGWPFGMDTLQPYYDRAEPLFGLRQIGFDSSNWADDRHPVLPLPSSEVETAIIRFSAPARFGDLYRDAIGRSENISAYLHANVTLIEPDENGRHVEQLIIRTLTGRRIMASARFFVLATGGIENARLLLASDNVMPNGVGNSNDLVGRFFMDHPGIASGLVMITDPNELMGLYTGGAQRESLLSTIDDGGSMEKYLTPEQKRLVFDWAARGAQESEYRESIAPIFEKRCVSCHNPESIGFQSPLRNYDEVMATMPPSGSEAENAETRDALAVLRLPGEKLTQQRLLNYCAILEESRGWSEVVGDDGFWRSVGNIASNFGSLTGATYRKLFDKDARRQLLRIVNVLGPSPNPDSRVTLNDERDALGMRRVNLDWRINESDKRTIAATQNIFAHAFGMSGLGRVLNEFEESDDGWLDNVTHGWHHMGTTRMHDDSKQGVVDKNCRVHGMDNLYIAGSSVFPTYGFANPTYTIVALALRIADELESVAG